MDSVCNERPETHAPGANLLGDCAGLSDEICNRALRGLRQEDAVRRIETAGYTCAVWSRDGDFGSRPRRAFIEVDAQGIVLAAFPG